MFGETIFQSDTLAVITIVLISVMIFVSPSIISNSDAREIMTGYHNLRYNQLD